MKVDAWLVDAQDVSISCFAASWLCLHGSRLTHSSLNTLRNKVLLLFKIHWFVTDFASLPNSSIKSFRFLPEEAPTLGMLSVLLLRGVVPSAARLVWLWFVRRWHRLLPTEAVLPSKPSVVNVKASPTYWGFESFQTPQWILIVRIHCDVPKLLFSVWRVTLYRHIQNIYKKASTDLYIVTWALSHAITQKRQKRQFMAFWLNIQAIVIGIK